MKYLTWWAAFLSCVDETSLSPHFKMLRLESCVEGEVADTVKGLQNSEAASQATRARLNRKYGGYKRQIQKLTGIRGITTVYFTRRKVHQMSWRRALTYLMSMGMSPVRTYKKVKEHEQRRSSLRTVPVILKHEAKHLHVNYF